MAEGQESADAAAAGAVELTYRPTVADIAAALRARVRNSSAGRFRRRVLVYILAVMVVGALLSTADAGRHDTPWRLYSALGVFVAVMTAVPWLQARQVHRLSERQGDVRAAVDDAGIRLTTAHSSATLDWHLYPRYVETSGLFVLLSADRTAVGVVALPKRGVAHPENVERLRAILDRNLVHADVTETIGGPRNRSRAAGRGAGSIGLLLLGLLLFLFAFAAVQKAAHPDRFPGIQNNNAPVSVVLLLLGVPAVVGGWRLVRRMRVMRIVSAVLAAGALLAGSAVVYRVGPMLHCWDAAQIARGPAGDYACLDF
ncbi:YcxB family protein [Streptomyces sp. NPDC001231]|uniref:YcxB family protein n=1 Tax=Streptomyces sp. NPDC001231 TaxID=3364549 RepID=UPI003691CDD5